MTTTELIKKVRFEIKDDDDLNGYRFSRLDLETFVPDAVREIYRKRPDIRLNARFEMDTFTSLYTYSGCDGVFESLDDIVGWDKVKYPELIFTCTSDNNFTVSGEGTDLFTFSYIEPFTFARIIDIPPPVPVPPDPPVENVDNFGGLIYPLTNVPASKTYNVVAEELDIPVDFFVERALVYYLAYSAFSVDNEDTFNNGRATEYFNRFLFELGVAT
jgi:hypothetical protein